MAGLTSSGLVIKTYPEVIASMQNKLLTQFGSSFDVSETGVIGQWVNICGAEVGDLWEALQGVYDANYPKSATDINLDNVAALVNVTRLDAVKSYGNLKVTGTVGSTIPINSAIKILDTEDRFFTDVALTLLAANISDVTIGVSSVVNNYTYTITLAGVVLSYTSDSSATDVEIVNGLKALVDASGLLVTTSLPTSTTLKITVNELDATLSFVAGTNLTTPKVSNIVPITAEFFGLTSAPANTITNLMVPVFGIDSVTNLKAVTEGRDRETDEEFRVRRYQSVGIIGASTSSAIAANVRNLKGVTSTYIIENKTAVIDVDGRPSHSFETVVEGGDDDLIARTIWDYHPVGIESYGSITKVLPEGTVKFSRPTTIYIKVRVEYTKYSEEEFAVTGEDGIKAAVIAYGDTLGVGVNVIPQRFFGEIYNSVGGLESLVVKVSKSTDLISWTAYQTTPIAIGKLENSLFDISRVETVLV